MIELIDNDLKPIRLNNSFIQGQSGFTHYPVLNENDEIIGIVEEDRADSLVEMDLEILDQFILQQPVHPLACMMRMKELDSNVVFLIKNGIYKGAITYNSLVHYFQDFCTMTRESAVLTLSIPSFIFSLSELALIVESEGNKILSFQSRLTDIETTEIDLVFQTNDLKRIIGILENKGYQIISIYNETGVHDHLLARYENLMTYLNI
jgi:hypothetical protein